MDKVRISKEFRFEMAHALWNYDGPCKNVHGHSYILVVTVIGEPLNDFNNVKNGMVMDFGVLKKIVNENIFDKLDHALVISENGEYPEVDSGNQMFNKVVKLPYQPTCENMVIDFAKIIQAALPDNVELFSIKLNETASSYAEWYKADNV